MRNIQPINIAADSIESPVACTVACPWSWGYLFMHKHKLHMWTRRGDIRVGKGSLEDCEAFGLRGDKFTRVINLPAASLNLNFICVASTVQW